MLKSQLENETLLHTDTKNKLLTALEQLEFKNQLLAKVSCSVFFHLFNLHFRMLMSSNSAMYKHEIVQRVYFTFNKTS